MRCGAHPEWIQDLTANTSRILTADDTDFTNKSSRRFPLWGVQAARRNEL
jgi:hypothetical protein